MSFEIELKRLSPEAQFRSNQFFRLVETSFGPSEYYRGGYASWQDVEVNFFEGLHVWKAKTPAGELWLMLNDPRGHLPASDGESIDF